ncbi:molecular chaperone [Ralstonia pseudosolanacearum]|uniref:TorD/DmsD family molecular chaperone n=1 Tax=Ralstonia solanacearum species complex TaxID=3116862 RepID=UPI002005DEB1|nr:molecular chaperone [Ralstonia pseudosolanacearum]MCK4121701.1 molecular chaperone [Ralstonia pseudosolanacearum]
MTDAQPLQFQLAATPADSAEDLARADLYGLLATLLYRAPDAGLLQRIAAAPLDPADAAAADPADAEAAAGSALTQAWRRLVARAGQTTAAQADDEYTELFIGVGKPEVFLYGSYYQAGFLNEKPLVVLRADLRRYGLERAEGITETEDHLATLCEVMRYLIAGEDVAVAHVAEQRTFFQRHLAPWAESACDAVLQHPRAAFYAGVAGLAKAFFEVERLALELA